MQINAFVVPYDSGSRGTRMGAGPERLLECGVLDGLHARNVGVSVATFASEIPDAGEVASAFEIQHWLAREVAASRRDGGLPLVLAGNCITSIGTVAGLLTHVGRAPGVCWLDAHADMNTPETTQSGFLDGMALAMLTGRCWPQMSETIPGFEPVADAQVLLLGARDIDPMERETLEASGIEWLDLADAARASERLDALRGRVDEVYLHIDLDVLDESEGRVNQYASQGGLSRARLLDLVQQIGTRFHIGAAALTAYDPAYDSEARIPPIARALVDTLAELRPIRE